MKAEEHISQKSVSKALKKSVNYEDASSQKVRQFFFVFLFVFYTSTYIKFRYIEGLSPTKKALLKKNLNTCSDFEKWAGLTAQVLQ